MKGKVISVVAFVSLFVFLIISLNPVSFAKVDETKATVDPRIYDSINKDGMTTVIIELKDNIGTKEIGKTIKISNGNINGLVNEMKDYSSFEVVYRYEAFNSLAVKVDSVALEALRKNPYVKSINYDDVLYTQLQESLALINATSAWNYVTPYGNQTGVGQTVCVIDTGVDYTNPALGNGVWGAYGNKVRAGYDFVNSDSDPMDDNGHGTHVAGIIAANGVVNGSLIRGVAPSASLIAVKSCSNTGSCLTSRILSGINYCLTVISPGKLAAISMSVGTSATYTSSTCPTTYNAAINSAYLNGVPVVIASGNSGNKTGISSPACSPNATSVGMTYDANVGANSFTGVCVDVTTAADKVACATNSGPNLKLMAPGSRITSTASSIGTACGAGSGNQLGTCSGTSMAAPHVAGAIALVKQRFSPYLSNPNPSSSRSVSMKIERLLISKGVSVIDLGNNLAFPRIDLSFIA